LECCAVQPNLVMMPRPQTDRRIAIPGDSHAVIIGGIGDYIGDENYGGLYSTANSLGTWHVCHATVKRSRGSRDHRCSACSPAQYCLRLSILSSLSQVSITIPYHYITTPCPGAPRGLASICSQLRILIRSTVPTLSGPGPSRYNNYATKDPRWAVP
jgi:hypothetical protein